VGNGATLGGAGTISTTAPDGITVASGGKLAPGNSIGALSATKLLWDAGGVLNWELAAPGTSDFLSLTGAFERSGTGARNFTFAALPGFAVGTYTLAQFASTNINGGSFGAIPSTELTYSGIGPSIGSFSLADAGGGRTNLLFTVSSAIPEPHVALLVLLGLPLLRRRRRSN
jgi:hypothetical protein